LVRFAVSEFLSACLGFALGLAVVQCIFQTLKPLKKPTRQVVICLKCGGTNSVENKFCWHCGEALYPQTPTICRKCSFPLMEK
jgi:ribosomal protein L40E